MKIRLGILAYNEEASIGRTLDGLSSQDLWNNPQHECGLLIIVNGTTDRTVEIAETHLKEFPVPGEVKDIPEPGKENAWNKLIHEYCPDDTEILILADADIVLDQPHALRTLVEALENHPEAVASVDEPIKSDTGLQPGGAKARLSQSASALATAGPPKLCGQLYAARMSALQKIFLPEPMLVEDGFIKAMFCTNAFTEPDTPDRLVRAEGIVHFYEAETGLKGWIKHEKRILLGTLCNILLFEKAESLVQKGEAVGQAFEAETATNPSWFRDLIQKRLGPQAPNRRLGILLPVPWRQMKHLPFKKRLKSLPAACIRTALNLLVMREAAKDLKQNKLAW